MPLSVMSPTISTTRHVSSIRSKECAHKPALKDTYACQLAAGKCFQKVGQLHEGARSSARILTLCAVQSYSPDRQPSPDISLLSSALQRQWHHSRNAHLGNIVIKPHTSRKVSWICDQCPDGHLHEWVAAVSGRSNGTGCPYCANKAVCQHNSLHTKAPEVAAEFSAKNSGTAHDYVVQSNKRVLWQCKHGHEWTCQIGSRTSKKHSSCPECSRIQKQSRPKVKLPVITQNHRLMHLWDVPQNAEAGLDPSRLTCGSRKKIHWICHCCPKGQPHRWLASPNQIYHGSGCSFCSGRRPCVCNSLAALFPEVAAEWDQSKNEDTPADYTASSHARVWWHNGKQGSFKARIGDRTCIRKRPLDL